MGLEDFSWVAAPPRRHVVARGFAWATFWLAVLAAAIALGWGLAEGLAGTPLSALL